MLKAYVGPTGDPADGRWSAHTEHEVSQLEVEQGTAPTGVVEWTEWGTAAEGVAWARGRTGWVLMLTESGLAWAGEPELRPEDVMDSWQE